MHAPGRAGDRLGSTGTSKPRTNCQGVPTRSLRRERISRCVHCPQRSIGHRPGGDWQSISGMVVTPSGSTARQFLQGQSDRRAGSRSPRSACFRMIDASFRRTSSLPLTELDSDPQTLSNAEESDAVKIDHRDGKPGRLKVTKWPESIPRALTHSSRQFQAAGARWLRGRLRCLSRAVQSTGPPLPTSGLSASPAVSVCGANRELRSRACFLAPILRWVLPI
jgi:hypothetical protein